MKPKNNTLNRLLVVAFMIMLFQAGCATTPVTETPLSSTEAVKTATSPSEMVTKAGLTEITDPGQLPVFKDDYGRIELLYAMDKSRKYFEKIESYPSSFKSMGFTPEKQIETLNLFRDGYVNSKDPQELSKFIAKNFRIFQANGGTAKFKGYGFAVFGDNIKRKWDHTVYNGSIGLPVTPIRGIATDDRVFPPGGLAFVHIKKATNLNEKGQTGKSFFTLTHDSKSTTKAANRAEVFFGIGKDALKKAENFNTSGKLYYLLKK